MYANVFDYANYFKKVFGVNHPLKLIPYYSCRSPDSSVFDYQECSIKDILNKTTWYHRNFANCSVINYFICTDEVIIQYFKKR